MSGQPDSEGPFLLGVDLGTSSCKVGLFGAGGDLVAAGSEAYPLHLAPGGGAEQEPEDWWSAVVAATTGVLKGGRGREVAGVGVAGQWSGTVPIGKDGKALRRAIIWMDTRGEEWVRKATGGFPSISGYRVDRLLAWLRKTGGAPAHSGKDSAAHILYLKAQEPEFYSSTTVFLEPKDYINFRLTGEYAASYDDIALTWVTDNRDPSSVKYDRGLLDMLGVDGSKLPPLKKSTDVVGGVTREAAAALGIEPGTPVVAGAGDMQASLVGSGCTAPYRCLLYLGTSAWLTAHVPFKKTDIFHNIASLPSAIPRMYFVAAEQESAGSALEFARSLLFAGRPVPTFGELDSIASTAGPAEGEVLFAPWLVGERTPVEDKGLRGAFANLTMGTGAPQLLRAVLEGVAYNARWMLGPVEGLAGRKADCIRVSGGGGNSGLWCQIMADVLGRRVQAVEEPVYATARGGALLAGVGTGLATFDGISSAVRTTSEFTPDPASAKVYDRMFQAFLKFHAGISSYYRGSSLSRGTRAT